jgi:hypothetical protein
MRRWRRRIRRLIRRVRYHRRTPRIKKILLYGGTALVGLSFIWLVVTGLVARSQLAELNSRLARVKTLVASGQIDDARKLAADVPLMSQRAHHLTTGPVWWVAAHVPYFGEPLDVTRGTALATEQVGTHAVPQLLDVARLINPASLRAGGNTVRVAPLVNALPQLTEAARALDESTVQLSQLPTDTWLGVVNSKRAQFSVELQSIRGYVDAAARAAKVLPAMLGQNGETKRYFIGLQNEAELRGTGGLPGAFAIAAVTNGTIKFERFESDAALLPPGRDHAIATGLDFGKGYDALYGPSLPTTTFVDSNVSPHFPYAAQIWAAMWTKVSGEKIDGAMAVDPTALSYFLAATGPTKLPNGGVINAANVVSLTQRDNYFLFPDNADRKAFLVSVLKAASKRLTSGAGTAYNIIKAASLAGSQQRLLAWSKDPTVEKQLEETDFAGVIPGGDRPFGGVVLNNAAAGKLDYYLERSMTYTRTGCGSRRDVIVTITLKNDAPASGLPLYVAGRADKPPPDAVPGDNHALVDYYATGGALLQSVTLNGEPTTASSTQTLGKAVFRLDLELKRAATQTVVLHLDEPAGHGTPRIWRQPGVTPIVVRSFDQPCG